MSLSDAQIAQGLATFHRKSIEKVVRSIGHVNALLAIALKKGKVKYGGHGTHFDWRVGKLDEEATYTSGQLGTRTFTESDPVDEASLPYCFLEKTYGVSEKSIKTNRAAGFAKVFDIIKENAMMAEKAVYRTLAKGFYTDGTNEMELVGLPAVVGLAYEAAADLVIPAAKSYAGIQCTPTAGIAAIDELAELDTANAHTTSGTNAYWAPYYGLTSLLGGTWAANAVQCLTYMETVMSRTTDMGGTGDVVKPDIALMNMSPFVELTTLMASKQTQIPLGKIDVIAAHFKTIQVGNITCVYDENVPVDSTFNASGDGEPCIFVGDSSSFAVETLNTKSEGLIEGEWDTKDVKTVGGVGVYKSNVGYRFDAPNFWGMIIDG